MLSDLDIADLTKRFNLTNIDDVFASIGYGGITAKQAIGKVVAQRKQQEKLARKNNRLFRKSKESLNEKY